MKIVDQQTGEDLEPSRRRRKRATARRRGVPSAHPPPGESFNRASSIRGARLRANPGARRCAVSETSPTFQLRGRVTNPPHESRGQRPLVLFFGKPCSIPVAAAGRPRCEDLVRSKGLTAA